MIALTLCVLMTVLCLIACGGKSTSDDGNAKASLVGAWAANEAKGAAYVFNEDGTGKWDMGDGLEMNFTYADKGTTVAITYEGSSTAQSWEYTVDGSTLTMKDTETGTILTYTTK